MKELSQWEFSRYEVLQITLTREFLAVYAVDKDAEGNHRLEAYPIDGLAVARVTTKRVEGVIGDRIHRVLSEDVANEIVGVELCEGYWHVCNDASNYAGLMREGDDIRRADGCLNISDYPLQKEFQLEESEPNSPAA